MNFELTGTLIEKYGEVQVTETFKKREFVIEKKENNYSDYIKFQLTGDRIDLISPFQIGEEIKVHFNIRGNKWKDNYFVNLQAWRIERITSKSGNNIERPKPISEDELPDIDESDGLPF